MVSFSKLTKKIQQKHTEIRMRPGPQLPRILGELGRVVQQSHDAHRVVGCKLAKDAVAVRQALGEDLEHGEGQVDDGGVVGLGGGLEVGRGEAGGKHVLAEEMWMGLSLGRGGGDVLANVEALLHYY